MTLNSTLRAAAPALLLLLGSCTIYTPLQPPTSLIREAGEVEASAGVRLSGHVQGAVTYSPASHLLVRGMASWAAPRTSPDTLRYRSRQWEAAAGTYWPLDEQWVVGGFAGIGGGRSTHWYSRTQGSLGLLGPSTVWSYRYEAKYQRPFAEAYLVHAGRKSVSFGGTYRLNYVRFTRFTNDGAPTGFRRMWRHEPQAFIRYGAAGNDPSQWLGLQLTTGLSVTPGFVAPTERAGNRDAVEPQRGGLYTTLSVVVRPHFLWRR